MHRITLSLAAAAALAASAGAQQPPTPPPTPPAAERPAPAPLPPLERHRRDIEEWRLLELPPRVEELQWRLQHEMQPHLEDLQWRFEHDFAPRMEEFGHLFEHEFAPRMEEFGKQFEFDFAPRMEEFGRQFEYELAPRLHDLQWDLSHDLPADFDLQQQRLQEELEARARELEHASELRSSAMEHASELRSSAMEHASELRSFERERAAEALQAGADRMRFDVEHALRPWGEPRLDLPESLYPQDPADSLYRLAREMVNRGEYRRAAETFRAIEQRYASSKYAQDALYWQAFALYRIGTVADMRAALAALEQQRSRFPRAQTDRQAASLAMRIRGELAANGDAEASQALQGAARSAPGSAPAPDSRPMPGRGVAGVAPGAPTRSSSGAQQGANCDRDDMAVRLEALSALSRIESPEVTPALRRVLQRRDECSATLRRRAVLLLGRQTGDEVGPALIDVARNDPDTDVRREAIGLLAKVPSDASVAALQEILQTGDARLMSSAMRALNANENPRARQAVRTIIERNDIAESTRLAALSSFRRATPEEAAYLRSTYPKLESRRLREEAIETLARIGGTENQQWLMALVRNEGEAMELRSEALGRLAATAPIADVGQLYGQVTDRRLKERIISSLASRKEPEAVDQLIAIARGDSDAELRRAAIARLSQKKDPRTTQLLLEIINK